MTDLQVKYQQLMHDKEVLAEDKRLHDAQIAKFGAETTKVQHEWEKLDADTKKLLAEYDVTMKDLEYYESDKWWEYAKNRAGIFQQYASGAGSLLKGVGSLIG